MDDEKVDFTEKKKITTSNSQESFEVIDSEQSMKQRIGNLRVINDPNMRFNNFLKMLKLESHELTDSQKNTINENLSKINSISKEKRTTFGRILSTFKNAVTPETNSEETYLNKIYEQIPSRLKKDEDSLSTETSSQRSSEDKSIKATLSKKPIKNSYLTPDSSPIIAKRNNSVHPMR